MDIFSTGILHELPYLVFFGVQILLANISLEGKHLPGRLLEILRCFPRRNVVETLKGILTSFVTHMKDFST
jgi:hypothetical protein